ncbi:MAG: rhodanese-like domain-containing protein [Hungatella sp.]|nr:rhodanese-like domain-containing protein [Hungatella sp.]
MKKILPIILTAAVLGTAATGCAAKTVQETTAAPAAQTTAAETTKAAETTQAAAEDDTKAEETTAAAEADAADPVKEAAISYFADFPEDRHMINVADLFVKMDAGEDMLIIDIRQPDAYAEGHLKGAVNIPYGPAIAENLDKIPDDVMLYVNCYSGQTSSQTVALLNIAGKYATNIQSGYNNGISVLDGYEAYIETTENVLLDETYEVDEAIAAAIGDYYAKATSDTFSSFNFPVDSLGELVDAESEDYTILSVRQAKDFAEAHIPGAFNIPFAKGMQEQFSQIPADKPVVVYCYTGQTASQVMGVLRMLGYEAYNLSGGMGSAEKETGWLGAGLPTVAE